MLIDHGHWDVAPTSHPRASLAELLTACDATAELSAEDCIWLNLPPVGNECLS
jgi:hypothetical protein